MMLPLPSSSRALARTIQQSAIIRRMSTVPQVTPPKLHKAKDNWSFIQAQRRLDPDDEHVSSTVSSSLRQGCFWGVIYCLLFAAVVFSPEKKKTAHVRSVCIVFVLFTFLFYFFKFFELLSFIIVVPCLTLIFLSSTFSMSRDGHTKHRTNGGLKPTSPTTTASYYRNADSCGFDKFPFSSCWGQLVFHPPYSSISLYGGTFLVVFLGTGTILYGLYHQQKKNGYWK